MLTKTVDDLHNEAPELNDWSLINSQLKDYFSVAKTLLSPIGVHRAVGASKHRKIGNYGARCNDECPNLKIQKK
jgi:hypothetical protein